MTGPGAACGLGRAFGLGGYDLLYPRVDARVDADERLGGGLRFRCRSGRDCNLFRPVEGGADGKHDGETESDDHRPRPDLEERVSLEVAGEIAEPHVGAALPGAPQDRPRREAPGDHINGGVHASPVRRHFTA